MKIKLLTLEEAKEIRHKLKMKQTSLSKLLGYNPNYTAQVEAGKVNFTLAYQTKLYELALKAGMIEPRIPQIK